MTGSPPPLTTALTIPYNLSDPMSHDLLDNITSTSNPMVGSAHSTVVLAVAAAAAEDAGGAAGLPCLKDWIAVLFECFIIITLGYLSSRFKLISPEAKDLNSYLAKFALPMIIFLNIAQMDYETINWSFLTCIIIAKSIIFTSVSLLTLLISKPTNFGYAGSLSILVTQSNDFALGYPLIKSLYGESHGDTLNYLSLQAPIQLLIFNPLGIAMLEYEKSRQANKASTSDQGMNRRDGMGSNNSDENNNTSSGGIGRKSRIAVDDGKNNRDIYNGDAYRPDQIGNIGLTRNNSMIIPQQRSSSPKYTISNNLAIDQIIDCNHNHHYTQQHNIQGDNNNSMRNDQNNNSVDHKHDKLEIISIADSNHNRIKDVECKLERQLKLIRAQSEPEVEKSCLAKVSRADFLLDSTNSNYSSSPSLPPDELISCTNMSNQSCNQSCLVNYCSSHNTLISTELTQPRAYKLGWLKIRPFKCDFSFILALITNPLILASVVALFVNRFYGPVLPKYVSRVSNTIAASFAAPALFVIGLSMFGKFQLIFRNPSNLLLSVSLVVTKLLILPNLMRLLAMIILPRYLPADESSYLKDFSYLYGSLPTAPTAVLIAQQYSVLTNVVSISMLLSTVLSAPLLLGIALFINPGGHSLSRQIISPVDIS